MASDDHSHFWQSMSFLLIGVLIGLGIGKGTVYFNREITQKESTEAPSEVPAVVAQPTAPQREQLIAQKIDIESVSEKDHVRGSQNPELTFIEFSDTECPFCKSFHDPMKTLIEQYGDKVQWVYRHFPLDSLHTKARKEAQATECASEQGKFWEYLDRLFEITPSNDGLNLDELPKIAEFVGLEVKKFQGCLDSDKYADVIQNGVDQAARAGSRGTPYTVIVTKEGETFSLKGLRSFALLEQIVLEKL